MSTTTATETSSGSITISTVGQFPTPVTISTAMSTPLMSTASYVNGIPSVGNQAGSSQPGAEASTAQQIQDLNFYLKRLTVGGNGDVTHIESYGGGPDYGMFLDAVSNVGLQYGWSEAQTLRTVVMKLKDKAREYYGALLPIERPTTMDEMRNWFRRVFGQKLTISTGRRELDRCIRNPGEPLGEYAQRLKVIVNKMFPAECLIAPEKMYHRNMMLVNQFVDGLEGRLANEILRAGEFYSLDECLSVAEECEEIVSRMIPETKYDARMTSIMRVDARRVSWNNEEAGNSQEQMGSDMTSRPSRRMSEPRAPRNEAAPRRNFSRTYNRGEQRMVQHKRQGSEIRPNQEWKTYPYMRNRCLRCGDEGHLARGCTSEKREFCYHCGKGGRACSLNSTRPATQQPN